MLLHARSSNREANGRSRSSPSYIYIYASIISPVVRWLVHPSVRRSVSAGRIHLIKERINMNTVRSGSETNENKRYISLVNQRVPPRGFIIVSGFPNERKNSVCAVYFRSDSILTKSRI